MASTFAIRTAPSATATMAQAVTTGTGTTPKLLAKLSQISRPTAMPAGTPAMIPMRAVAVACQDTAK